jgi:acyl-CoA thioester hydrolase
MSRILSADKEIEVRFNEVDAYNIVWNGSYPGYFEVGRQEFGNKYGLSIDNLLLEGIYAPLTKMEINYRKPLRYNDRIRIRTTFIDSRQALLIFTYEISNVRSGELACTGRTEQAILNRQWRLSYFLPPFLQKWKDEWLTSLQPKS